MSMNVVFPNGQRIRYNNANWLQHGDGTWILMTKKDGEKIAFIQASAGVTVEFVEPCAVSNPTTGHTPEAALSIVVQHLRTLPAHKVRGLKQQLRAFNARKHSWCHV